MQYSSVTCPTLRAAVRTNICLTKFLRLQFSDTLITQKLVTVPHNGTHQSILSLKHVKHIQIQRLTC